MPQTSAEHTRREIQACWQCPHWGLSLLGNAPSSPATQHASPLLWSRFPHSPDNQRASPVTQTRPRTEGSRCCQRCHDPPSFSGCSRPQVSGCAGRTFLWHHTPCRANPWRNAPACTAAPCCASLLKAAATDHTSLAWPEPHEGPEEVPTESWVVLQLQQALSHCCCWRPFCSKV